MEVLGGGAFSYERGTPVLLRQLWGEKEAGLPTLVRPNHHDVIRKEAWPFYRTSSGVRLCWELEEPKGPKGSTETELGDAFRCE